VLVMLLAAANLINIGADIGALGAASALIIHVPVAVLMVGFTALSLALEIAVSYRRYARRRPGHDPVLPAPMTTRRTP
jgi:membrane protein implicated in regulation of membrane protease activity